MAPKGGFWTSNDGLKYEPKMQYRFKVDIEGFMLEDARGGSGKKDYAEDWRNGDITMWYAKSVDKPGYSLAVLGENEFPLGTSQPDIAVKVTKPMFKPVTMSLIDPTYPNITRKLLRFLRRSGYHDDGISNKIYGNITAYQQTIGNVVIHQLDQNGKSLEKWTLVNAFPVEFDFGKLDYSSTDPVTITIKWVYETFMCWMAGEGPEQEFTYFKDLPAGNSNLADFSDEDYCNQVWTRAKQGDAAALANDDGSTMSRDKYMSRLDTQHPCYKPLPAPTTSGDGDGGQN